MFFLCLYLSTRFSLSTSLFSVYLSLFLSKYQSFGIRNHATQVITGMLERFLNYRPSVCVVIISPGNRKYPRNPTIVALAACACDVIGGGS